MNPDFSERIKIGLDHHQNGRLQQAEAVYQSILREQPGHSDALYLLGVLALQVGKGDAAVDLIEKAIRSNPDEPEFHNMCGEAHRSTRSYDRAIACYERAIALRPGFAGAHNNLGNTLMEMGRLQDAVSHYEKAIAGSPEFPMTYNNLGVALKDLGRTDEAIAQFKRALELLPAYAEAHTNLGNAIQESGRPDQAIAHHEQALSLRPDFAEAHGNLGNALRMLGRLDEAMASYGEALALQPGLAMAHYNLGIALDEVGRPSDAVASYRRALDINPNYADAHHNLGNALSELGQRDDAVAHYEQAIAIRPDYAEAYRNLTRIAADRVQAPAVEKLLAEASWSDEDAMHGHFALGNVYDRLQQYDQAFRHYAHGNAAKRQSTHYDPGSFSAHVDRLIKIFSADYFRREPTPGSQSDLPVFVVGMPRSGTSLVEQILSSHPRVFGAGELVSMARIERDIAGRLQASAGYPHCMTSCDETVVDHYSRLYLDELREHSEQAERITDKMPDNFMRLGLIKTLFPQARLVHCQRNALDTCVSNYLNYFATGNEYSFDLTELGQYYRDYRRLMEHWATVFGADLQAVQYEDLVANQERVSRGLIGHLGLDWDDRCLDFHQNTRAVNTFSSLQVRQPIYADSVARWKRYEKHLAPLIASLDGCV